MLHRRKKKFGGFTVAGVEQKEEKNRGMQLLVVVAMLITGFGGVLSSGGSLVGFALLAIGLLSLLGLFVSALRHWDY